MTPTEEQKIAIDEYIEKIEGWLVHSLILNAFLIPILIIMLFSIEP